MLKIEGLHKVTNFGATKNNKPYIFLHIAKLTNSIQTDNNQYEITEQWIGAKVFFASSNIDINELTKEHKAELCAYRIMGIEKWESDKTPKNTENYTIKVYADYVRFVKFKDKDQDNKEKPKNDKIETTQSSSLDPWEDLPDTPQENSNNDEFDWEEDI